MAKQNNKNKFESSIKIQETGTIRKNWNNKISVVLVYPNKYFVGMANLGFQTVYNLINKLDNVVCERAFLPEEDDHGHHDIISIESEKPLYEFDIIAFSISFESDYPNVLTILENLNIPFYSKERDSSNPLIISGGVACFINPEPISPFIDAFLIGEAEVLINKFFDIFDPFARRVSILESLAKNLPGIYVPAFYEAKYNSDNTLSSFYTSENIPLKIKRAYLKDLSLFPTCSTVLTHNMSFADTFLIETGRGCFHGCRFCAAGYIYRPPRFQKFSLLEKCLKTGVIDSQNIGLVGTAVSDLPDIGKLCIPFSQKGVRISFSSIRADALTQDLIDILKLNNAKTATIAPDAGSERMRNVINKGITRDQILEACEKLVGNGIINLKLYFMIGLPTETMEDVEAIVQLCRQVKSKFLKASKIKGHIGEITISVNAFVPKPFTPFQWASMDNIVTLKQKISKIKNGLKSVSNVRIHADIPRWSYIQALFSRGDRKVADILLLGLKNRWNWPKTFKESHFNPDYYLHRERSITELFPWDFIDHGIDKSFLIKEWQRAKENKPSPVCPMTQSCKICGVCSNLKTDAKSVYS